MTQSRPITFARGDGIGPEIMDATLRVLEAAGASIDLEEIEVGEAVYKRGHTTGIEDSAWESLRRTKVFLKAPITTPQGGGHKSLNVAIRKSLGLYANVRPCLALHPYVTTKHPELDVIIVRENEEDLYSGIEYRQTTDVEQSLKIISRPGSERIVRYAFEHATRFGRRKVTAFTKDNIMKQSDGLFHRVFDEVAAEYPDIENEHWIVDIGAAKLAASPGAFDVVVLPNLYGDILSDVTAQIAGSVGLSGSANIGKDHAMFEAIHGSAPRRAGQNLANPSGLLQGAVLMLLHIGQHDVATRIHNAWLTTLEQGVHTYDIYSEERSTKKVGTKEFADAIIANLGNSPKELRAVSYTKLSDEPMHTDPTPRVEVLKELVGFDVFLDWTGVEPTELAVKLEAIVPEGLILEMISNRGQQVWPKGQPDTFYVDQWRCRFMSSTPELRPSKAQLVETLTRIEAAGLDFVKIEILYNFDGKRGYSVM